MQATAQTVRESLPAESRDRSTTKGLAYFVVAALLYWASFVAIALPSSWLARIGVALVNGLTVGSLFIVGHDACHGSLTPNSTLNAWLGRIALLPSLHPYSAWEYSHNVLHHGFTNLRRRDPMYCPRSMEEFQALSPLQRRLARMYRSWIGMLPLYLLTIWWPFAIRPSALHRAQMVKHGTLGFDRALVLAFLLVQIGVLYATSTTHDAELVGVIALGVAVPFLAFSWLIGFATFQHHTHPRVLWYRDESEWNFFQAQVRSTVHVEYPRWFELLLNNIMEHTAHHVDTRVPLYNLTNAQDRLEQVFGAENVVTERFSFAGMSATFRTCQLYDYDSHRWLTFDGVPTTPPRSLDAVTHLELHTASAVQFGAFVSSSTLTPLHSRRYAGSGPGWLRTRRRPPTPPQRPPE
jgi:omega-6 fatty acid desaturase (delta-12 desaturase)